MMRGQKNIKLNVSPHCQIPPASKRFTILGYVGTLKIIVVFPPWRKFGKHQCRAPNVRNIGEW